MRVFALSDIHIDYQANADWVAKLSTAEYRDDVLILAGDVTDTLSKLEWCLKTLVKRFRKVLFVPGNHDLWVIRDQPLKSSLQKFDEVVAAVESSGGSMETFRHRDVTIVPILTWYDYSFGEPSEELRSVWMDYRACRWPGGFTVQDVAAHFTALNKNGTPPEGKVITYSHFVPRLDLMPSFAPCSARLLYPILGSTALDRQLRALNSSIHVYGHSHVNRHMTIDGVTYINNAFGYPHETFIASKRLVCIHEC
jgi:predicted phosphodiesterase